MAGGGHGGGGKAVVAAFFANLGIAIAKFIGFLFTGSSSMLAESVHSVAAGPGANGPLESELPRRG